MNETKKIQIDCGQCHILVMVSVNQLCDTTATDTRHCAHLSAVKHYFKEGDHHAKVQSQKV